MISVTLDIEMPKCCGACHFARADDEMDFARCALLGHISEWFYYESDGKENRHPDCPLVEVVSC
jgi:hypothetical protein